MVAILHVYVAASSREAERVRRVMDWIGLDPRLRLTTNWLSMMEVAGKADRDLDDDERQAAVVCDLGGIETADVLWLLAPETSSRGAWFEFGFAAGIRRTDARGMALIASGDTRQSVFGAAAREFRSDAVAFGWLTRQAALQAQQQSARQTCAQLAMPWQG